MPNKKDLKDKVKELIHKEFGILIKEINEEDYTMKFVFSNQVMDRHGEIVDQKGWKLDEFRNNPVVLFAHDYWEPAVGQVTDIGIEAGQLEGTIKFAVKENPKAEILWKLYKGKYMRAVSAGFSNEVSEYNEDTGEMILRTNTLYEMSLVPVPANAMALAKQKGIDAAGINERKEEEKPDESEANEIDEMKELVEGISKKIKIISADINAIKKVETPAPQGGNMSIRAINKAMRDLMKRKKILKNNS